MSTATTRSIPTQPEDYRAILGYICAGNWIAIAAALIVEVFLRTSESHQWPHWGNFSLTYNFALVEFAVLNLGVVLLLRRTEWLDRAPREALGRLRWVLLALLALDGLHLLGFLRMTGGVQGPAIVLVPPVILTLYLLLPRSEANPAAFGFLVILLLVAVVDILSGGPAGMLAEAFKPDNPVPLPWFLVVVVGLVLAMLVGLAACGKMEKAGVSLRSQLNHDPQTGLFSREVLERRVPGELGRIGRSESNAALLMIGFKNIEELLPHGDYAGFDKVVRDFAGGLNSSTRAADTCVRYDVASFAALLPTASSETVKLVIDRIQKCADAIRPQENADGSVDLAVGVAVASASSQADPASFVSAAQEALREAHAAGEGHQVVSRKL